MKVQLNGSIAQANPTKKMLTQMIDSAARRYWRRLKRYQVTEESIQRFACYTAVSGRSADLSLSEEPLLVELDPSIYFPNISVEKTKRLGLTKRRRYKIAYLILAHKSIGNLVELLKHLSCPDAIILVHIDGKNSKMLNQLQTHIIMHPEKFLNIYFFEKPFKLSWGSPYIVFAELEGYLQLLDLADWDYVINLSVYDFPLMSTAAIHQELQKDPGKSYIKYWRQDYETLDRLAAVHFPFHNFKKVLRDHQQRYFYWLNKYTPYKHHQWMILSQEFIQLLRKSKQTYELLAFMEFIMIPDESFFATVALCPDLNYKHKVVNDAMRYIYFIDGQSHPISLHDGDENILTKDGRRYFFVRKVNVLTERKLLKWMLKFKEEMDVALGIKKYGQIVDHSR